MNRLFVAAWPPPAVVDALTALRRVDDPAVRWTSAENWHVTLRFCGDVDGDALAAALDGAALPSAQAMIGPTVTTMSRTRPPHIIVPVAGLDDLAAAVRAATDGLVEPERRRFRGHLTLARLRRRADARAEPPLIGTPVTAEWDVDAITLVASNLHPDGARYTTLHRWPIPT